MDGAGNISEVYRYLYREERLNVGDDGEVKGEWIQRAGGEGYAGIYILNGEPLQL